MLATLLGCQTRPSLSGDLEFDLSGKLGIRTPERALSARFRWRQAESAFQIELWGPLGQGRTILLGDAEELTITNARGDLLDQGPAEDVMQRQLGWSLPLAAFPSWLRGQPIDSEPLEDPAQGETGQWLGFRQLGWDLRFERHDIQGHPTRLVAERPGYRVRVVL